MSQKQLHRFSVISMALEAKVTVSEAAKCLMLSERQIKRLKKGGREQDPAFLIHKNTNHKPKHAIPDKLKKKIVALKQSDNYIGANFTHFMELIAKHNKIKTSYSSLYRTLTEAGIKSPKKRRKPKAHNRRKRKPREGLLIQTDATLFANSCILNISLFSIIFSM